MAAPPNTNAVFRFHDGKVQPVSQELPALKPNEVLLRITHSGLCHSDTYYISSGMALGHEGVGVVAQVGSAVTTLKVGERAGGGYLRGVS
jgi:D-arabinose 1-dehydrogenase-like Zn-dependent alcohol dehydrogenase